MLRPVISTSFKSEGWKGNLQWEILQNSENTVKAARQASLVTHLLYWSISNTSDFAHVWPTALKLGRIINFNVFFLVIGFNILMYILYEYWLVVIFMNSVCSGQGIPLVNFRDFLTGALSNTIFFFGGEGVRIQFRGIENAIPVFMLLEPDFK